MNFKKYQLLIVLAASLFVGAIASNTSAGINVGVTVQNMNSAFTADLATPWSYSQSYGTTTDTLPYQNSSAIIDSGFFGYTVADDPFGGNVDWSIGGTFSDSGTPPSSLDPDLQVDTSTGLTYYMKVTVQASGFTSPGSNGSQVKVDSDYEVPTISNAVLSQTSSIDSTSITSPTVVTSFPHPDSLASYTRGSTYTLTTVYYVTLQASDFSQVNTNTTIEVNPVPEPCTILSALIGMVPLAYMARSIRRRKSNG